MDAPSRALFRLEGIEKWEALTKAFYRYQDTMAVKNVEPSQEAKQKARELVAKLAPEAIISAHMLKGKFGLVTCGSSIDGECCAFTFPFYADAEIPVSEKNLTLYLWKTLFPERFINRLDTWVWPRPYSRW